MPSTAPTDEKTKDLVTTIRDERPGIESGTGASYEVTGTTALNIDISEKVQGALIPYLVVVVGLAIVLLMVVFRSLLVPLKAALGFLLSVLASSARSSWSSSRATVRSSSAWSRPARS